MSVTPIDAFPPELSAPDDRLRPHRFYASMHDSGPIRWEESRECWDVFGFDGVRTVAADSERFSARVTANPDYVEPDGRTLLADSMLHADPPRHEVLRSVVDDLFAPEAVADLRPDIAERARELLDEATDRSAAFDLVTAYAYPLTVWTVAELLGVPTADREQFFEWTKFAMTASYDVEDPNARKESLLDYFERLVADSEANNDSEFAAAVAAADGLSDAERRNAFSVVLLGGLSTTNLVSNAVWSLAEAGLFADARAADAAERAVAETLRYRSPVQAHSRYAVAPAEVGGEAIDRGDKLCVWFAAANHDPTVFDNPGTFDLDRDPGRHLAFGHGAHYCLGAHVARLQATAALEALFGRFEELTVRTDAIEPIDSMLVYGPATLPVEAT